MNLHQAMHSTRIMLVNDILKAVRSYFCKIKFFLGWKRILTILVENEQKSKYLFVVCSQIIVGLCKIEIDNSTNNHIERTKIYVVRFLAYIHRQGWGENFTNIRKKLQRCYLNTLTRTQASNTPKNTHNHQKYMTRETWKSHKITP